MDFTNRPNSTQEAMRRFRPFQGNIVKEDISGDCAKRRRSGGGLGLGGGGGGGGKTFHPFLTSPFRRSDLLYLVLILSRPEKRNGRIAGDALGSTSGNANRTVTGGHLALDINYASRSLERGACLLPLLESRRVVPGATRDGECVTSDGFVTP